MENTAKLDGDLLDGAGKPDKRAKTAPAAGSKLDSCQGRWTDLSVGVLEGLRQVQPTGGIGTQSKKKLCFPLDHALSQQTILVQHNLGSVGNTANLPL